MVLSVDIGIFDSIFVSCEEREIHNDFGVFGAEMEVFIYV